jgi:hypothetical protein
VIITAVVHPIFLLDMKKILGFLFCIACCTPPVVAQQTRYVVIVVLDGARYSETYGDPLHRYLPHLWNELRPQGTIYTKYYNDGRTETLSGHTSILSGTWQNLTDDGDEGSHRPSMFEYYRKQTGADITSCFVALGKTKLQILGYSDDPNYGAKYGAVVSTITSSSDDDLAFTNLQAGLSLNHPRLTIANIPSIDTRAHADEWDGYLHAISHADSGVAALWSSIQSDPILANKTMMIVTNDHGRHLDGISTGFIAHGDTCDGCRHILMMVLGPDAKAGAVDTNRCSLVDIAPTVAAMMNFTVPLAVGKVIRSFMGSGVVLARSVHGEGIIKPTPSDSTFGVFSKGTTVTVRAIPAMGCLFTGWAGALTGMTNPQTIVMNADQSITASFAPMPGGVCELRADVEGKGSIDQTPTGNQFVPGTSVTLRAAPGPDYKFVRWSGDTVTTNASITLTVAKHTRVIAEFIPIPDFSLNVRECPGGSVHTNPSGTAFREGTRVAISAVAKPGWTFTEWTGGVNGSRNPDTVIVSKPVELRPIFRQVGGTTYELPVKEDSYVRGGMVYSSKNFNNELYLLVREGVSTLNQARAFLKFDATGIKGKVQAAWLKVYVKADGLPDGVPVQTNVYSVSDNNWLETTIKYTNAPLPGVSIDSTNGIYQAERYYAWDVPTAAVGAKIVTFMLKDDSRSDKAVHYERREGSFAPTLVVMTDAPTSVSVEGSNVPKEYRLFQNYPNPFNPSTRITFAVPRMEYVIVKVFDMLGREVAVLQDGLLDAGTHARTWNAGTFASGLYVCRMSASRKITTLRMTLLK